MRLLLVRASTILYDIAKVTYCLLAINILQLKHHINISLMLSNDKQKLHFIGFYFLISLDNQIQFELI